MSHKPHYLELSIGAPARLASLKRKYGENWRNGRHWGFKNWESAYCVLSEGKNQWYSHVNPNFRNERKAHEVLSHMRYTGWFSDADAEETICGMVASLPHGKFLAGYYQSMNGEVVWLNEIHDDAEDAARSGDGEAESLAEKEREYSERWREARGIAEDQIPEKIKRRTECLLLARINHDREGMREEACNLKSEIKDLQYELSHDYKDIEL